MALHIALPLAVIAAARLIGLVSGWREQMHANRQRRDFARLDGHLLRDIGVDRDALCWRWHVEALLDRQRPHRRPNPKTDEPRARNLVELNRYRERRRMAEAPLRRRRQIAGLRQTLPSR